MTAHQFRKMALALPEAVEGEHMAHPDFRVRKKIFATLCPDDHWGMVKLTPSEQKEFMNASDAFQPANGAWGKNGATIVMLKQVDRSIVQEALKAAWRNTAPERLVAEHDELKGSGRPEGEKDR